ncbi:hypothetical protein C4D60_Mb06t31660 [Musa balbisiana]|uniref:Pentacotripeptide-repeat region of PRORP domain-containing protein n=1 Tax=Musa balbisiana TaxID=52838 RepID=A0A4S8IS22_MUSBA|nr:hypothetical protein C4D60_Mb06t31660 [Musa balbisiana]
MTLQGLLRALGGARCLARGKLAHSKLIVSAFLPDIIVSNRVMIMYTKLGRVGDARMVFDHMPHKNVVSWTIMISAYSRLGLADDAIDSVRLMVSTGLDLNHYTYVGLLLACASSGAVRIGKEIHGRIYRVELGAMSVFVDNSLINFYAKCHMMILAQRVFDGATHRSLVSWGSILSGYVHCGENEKALRVFSWAMKEGVEVNEFMITSTLSACADLGDPMIGKQLHCLAIKTGNGSDQYVEAGIVDMYANCSKMDLAHQAFSELEEPGLATWAALIGGFTKHGQGENALVLFKELLLSGLRPNEHIFPTALVACSSTGAVQVGRQIHSLIVKQGFKMSAHIGNAVMEFYAKCGLIKESSKLFEYMEERDIVSWNSMVDCYVKQRDFEGARNCLKKMLVEGVNPDPYTYSSILNLCANLPGLGWGSQTHGKVIKFSLDSHVVVGSALIDMYAKCGRLKYADKIFNILAFKNLVSWNSILVGYAQHGFGREALDIFRRMQEENVKPNDITFIGVLSACSHVGLVEEGQSHFQNMKDYDITPKIDHFACMVDLFARAGLIKMAYDFIRSMPMEPNKVIWRSLLSGCKTHGDLEIGMYAAKCTLELDPKDIAARVMLSGVCADIGLWDEKAGLREKLSQQRPCIWNGYLPGN